MADPEHAQRRIHSSKIFSPVKLGSLSRRIHWLNLPGALLIALLQRTPVLRLIVSSGEYAVSSPVGQLLRSAFTLGALGAMHSRAGATTFIQSPENPVTGTVGTQLSVAFTFSGTPSPPQFFVVSGQLPPGMQFVPAPSGGVVQSGNPAITGTPTQAGEFTVFVQGFGTGGNGTPVPIEFVLTGGGSGSVPSFTTQPASQTVNTGASVTFTVAVGGSPAPTLQWQRNGLNIAGATNATLSLTNVQTSDAGTYRVLANNSAGTATSSAATLTVNAATNTPVFTTQPSSQAVSLGGTLVLSAAATGTPAPTFQWRRNGSNISGATGATLTLSNVQAGDAGTYTVVATNSSGSTTSAEAIVMVSAPSTGEVRLSNLSVRTSLPASQTLIVGLVVSGGGKDVLVRGAGPALTNFLSGAMADPRLELYNGAATLMLSNDDWPVSLAATFDSVFAFPFLSGSKDAAFLQRLDGGYTVQVKGTGGVVLVEAYDAGTGHSPRLINVSARNRVGTGDDILIAGFTLAGSGTKQLLIRGIGPRLADFGVGGVLADPKIEVYNAANTKLTENDNWSASLASVFSAVQAFELLTGSKDAALLITLEAGASYTVQVKGADGGTGEAVVEVYEVP